MGQDRKRVCVGGWREARAGPGAGKIEATGIEEHGMGAWVARWYENAAFTWLGLGDVGWWGGVGVGSWKGGTFVTCFLFFTCENEAFAITPSLVAHPQLCILVYLAVQVETADQGTGDCDWAGSSDDGGVGAASARPDSCTSTMQERRWRQWLEELDRYRRVREYHQR